MRIPLAFVTWTIPFLLFITIKVAGHSFIAWSWWWLLLPQVPALSLIVRHFGW